MHSRVDRLAESLGRLRDARRAPDLPTRLGRYAIAGGGMTGTGLGLGAPQTGYISYLTSDMILAAVGEELGFLGIILIVCLFAAFVGEGFAIAQRATSDYVRLAATGLTALMGFQAFFIMAGVLRVLPFTGITSPLRRLRRQFALRELSDRRPACCGYRTRTASIVAVARSSP